MALQTRPHSSGTVSSLCNLPHLTEHRLEDEIVERRTELETALKDVVSVLVEEQWDDVWLKIFDDHTHLFWGFAIRK